jgi:hypothetical protein
MQVGVVQFSNDVKVEVPPAPIELDTFRTAINDMVRASPDLTCAPLWFCSRPPHATRRGQFGGCVAVSNCKWCCKRDGCQQYGNNDQQYQLIALIEIACYQL